MLCACDHWVDGKGRSMIRNRILMLVILLGLASLPAQADTLTFAFTSDHCTGGCTTGAPNMGFITVTDVSSGVVNVSAQLQSGFGFVSTGAGAGAAFFFRLLGNPLITYSNITTGWTIPNVIAGNQQAAGSYAGDGLSGQFEYALSCNPSGASLGCGNGGSAPKASPLNFTVSGAGITAASFNDTGNASGSPFAADVISSNGNTGLIDASLTTILVFEPFSIVLLGAGILGLAITMRRKINR